MKKLISFLGKGEYNTVTYFYQEQEVTTNLFVEAAVKIFKPDMLILLLTESSLETGQRSEGQDNSPELEHVEKLKKELRDIVDIEYGKIPEGKSKKEIWEIFEICSRYVERDDKLLIDITHGFRSLPLIVFVSMVYLQRFKHAEIEAILYGAYEAKNDGRAPIFDLRELLDLFEWMVGVEFLKKSGDADLVAQALRRTQDRVWKEQSNSEQKPKKLQNLGSRLKDLSDKFKSVNPLEVMKQAKEVLKQIEEVHDEVKNWAKPFGAILDDLKEEIQQIAYDNDISYLTEENLKKQLAVIEYYKAKGRFHEAILCLREWIVDYVALGCSKDKWLEREYRSMIEERINESVKETLSKERGIANECQSVSLTEEQRQISQYLDKIKENKKDLTSIWDNITGIRNSIAHCGKPRKTQKDLQKYAEEKIGELKELLEQ